MFPQKTKLSICRNYNLIDTYMFRMGKPGEIEIREFLACQRESGFSYSKVGCSASASTPAGFVRDHNQAKLGYGEGVWNEAVRAVRTWQMFNLPWVRLCWPDAPIVPGAEVAILLRHFGFWSLNASRIVYIIDAEDATAKRYGFAYGTLLEHAESGEERFSVVWRKEDSSVWYDLFAFSRPRARLARVGYPLSRWLQHQFVRDSKIAMVKAVEQAHSR